MPVPTAEQLIRRFARKHGIDPRAAIAVARGEGGLRNRPGDIGDLAGGGSYGPFQLYAQGALPQHLRGNQARADAWAWSPQGIEYAIRQMAKTSARGKQGNAAINAIIREFERPADPDSSVRNAIGRYGGIAPGAPGVAPMPRQPRQPVGPNPMKMAGIQGLLDIATGKGNATQVFSNLSAAKTEARKWGGTLRPPRARGGQIPQAGSPALNKILQAAHSQIGKPYVWGGEDPNEGGFDCSGLLDWAFRQAGIDLPGRLTTQSAMSLGRSVKGKKLQPGDFLITNGGKHMVMYVGGNKVIAAPHRGSVVQYQDVSRFRGDIVDVRRVL